MRNRQANGNRGRPDALVLGGKRDGGDMGLASPALFIIAFVVSALVGVVVLGVIRASQTAGSTSIVDVAIGDCFVLPISGSDTEIYQVTLIDCAEPHNVEVVGRGDLNPTGELGYPTDDELMPHVDAVCGDPRRFHDVGFGVLPVAPNELTWNRHRGTYVCLGLWMDDGLVAGRQIALDL